MSNLFELACREKYRFPYKGYISTEDLWDLPMTALDDIYKSLTRDVKKQSEESLLADKTEDDELTNKIEIVKHIFTVKKEEAQALKEKAKNAEKRKRILEVLAQKQDESLRNMSEDELKKLLEEI